MIKYTLTYLLCCLSWVQNLNGQNVCVDSTSTKSFLLQNKSLYGILSMPTIDNGMLMIIAEDAANNLNRHGIAKVSANGSFEWTRIYTSKSVNQNFNITHLLPLKNGEYIIGGVTNYEDRSKPDKIILIKLNAAGNLVWQKQLNNNYGSSTQEIVNLQNLQEGYNGDIIVLTNDPNVFLNKNILARLNNNGQVIWSNAYFGAAFLIQPSANITGNDGSLHLWGVSYKNPANCFMNSTGGLSYMPFDYNSGQLINSKTYCIAPGNAPLQIDVLPSVGYTINGMITKRLFNGNTVVFLRDYGSERNLIINLFDSNYNFIKSTIYSVHNITIPPYDVPGYSFDASSADGNIVFNFSLHRSDLNYLYPFNFYVFLDSDLHLKKQLFVQEPGLDTVSGSVRFLTNGELNFVSSSRQHSNSPYYQLNYSNTLTGGGTGAFCNARDSIYGSFAPHGLVYSGSFQYDSIKSNVYTSADSSLFTISSFNILETSNCKIISICDSLKITGPAAICLSSDTVAYRVYKNPQCLKNIKWQIDTSFANLINATDSSLQLTFKKQGRFKLYAMLEGCVLKDSLEINISKAKTAFKIDRDSLLCPGKSSVLKAPKGFASYLWKNNSTADTLIITKAGLYSLTATDSCGNIFKDSLQVNLMDTSFALPPRQHLCITDTLYIKVPKQAAAITWQPATNGLVRHNFLQLFPDYNTRYSIRLAFAENCAVQKNIDITVAPCPETIFFPNSFTPNRDGLNDLFQPSISSALTYYHLQIYNRYGQKVFETNNPHKGWDGTIAGIPQNSGGFIWICRYQFANKAMMQQKGSCILIR